MGAISKKYVTAGVTVVAVTAIAIALVYSQRKKSTYNALVSSAADGVNRVIGGAPLDQNVWDVSRRYLVDIKALNQAGALVHSCGASLISRRVVLTAAHCFTVLPSDPMPPNVGAFIPSDSVDFNRYDQRFNEGVTTIQLCQTENNSCVNTNLAYVIRHPDWDANTDENDLALIVLPEGLQSTTFQPVTLNRNRNVPADGQMVEVFGWGLTSNNPDLSPNEIQTGMVRYLNNRRCDELWEMQGNDVTRDMMCAGTDRANGVDAGRGDSGGPLLLGEVQVGVVSWGDIAPGSTTRPERPGVYARVSFFFGWIRDTVCREVPEDEVFDCRRSKASKQTKQGKRV